MTLFATGAAMMMLLRFAQGIGSKGRGRFALRDEVICLVGLVPAVILLPVRFFLKERPRWLASRGRYAEADRIVRERETSAVSAGHTLAAPKPVPVRSPNPASSWRELFEGADRQRRLTTWAMWFCSCLVANGVITRLPALYVPTFNLRPETSLLYGPLTSVAGAIVTGLCAIETKGHVLEELAP